MAEKITIARPYAKAAFESAREHDTLAQWSDFLARASAVVADDRVAKLLSSPRVAPAELVALIADVCGELVDEQAGNFLKVLAHNRRLGLLPEVAAIFETLRAEVENVADVHVMSAVPLDEVQRQRLSAAMAKRLQRAIRLHCEVDPALIGGAVVRAGDFVLDGSLKARLQQLAVDIAY